MKMLIDITLRLTPRMITNTQGTEQKAFTGHLGTHFDVMDKEFPLEYTKRNGIVFDVSAVQDRDIDVINVDLNKVNSGMFVAFYSGFIEQEDYGTSRYFKDHPQLSINLINSLLGRGVSVIGIDFAGVRRGKEHTPMDQHCADHGVFIIENLCNLREICVRNSLFIANIYPINFSEMSGLPCRVVAELA
jgi:kynurenine formamidase